MFEMSKKTTILVADDDLASCLLIKEYFDKNKVDLIFAKNGKEAIERCILNQQFSF